ncbi:MAG: cytochrome P450 [Pseudomonadales bacterium]|nr:cytochrome P450 [Pseudomonadales bacterium]
MSSEKKLVVAPWFYKTWLLLVDPIAYMQEIAKLGDFVKVRGVLGFYLVNHPELIKLVSKDKNDNINRDNIIYNRLKGVSRTGLVTSEGDYWKKQRRTMNPLFTPRTVKSFIDKMVAASLLRVDHWEKLCDSGEVFNASKEMDRLTLEINGACLFNANLKHVYDDLQKSFDYINRYMEMIPLPIISESWFPSPSNIKLKRTVKKVDIYIDSLIAERKGNLDDHDDFLTALMRAKDEETGESMPDWAVRHEVLVAFIAGYETASTALCWAWYHLHDNPDVEEKLIAELTEVLGDRVPTLEDIPKLAYTKMFAEEVLRISPSAWLNGKTTVENDEYWGEKIPGKSLMMIILPCIHHHQRYWDDPEKFIPERFLPDSVKARDPFAYVPFGGGPHVCLGKHFALQELIIGIAVLAKRFKLVVEPDFKPVASAGISTAPKYPFMVRAQRRT